MAGTSCTSMVIEPGDSEHNARVGLNKLCDAFANQRIEPARGYAESGEDFGAEILTRFIGGVGHQNMVALFHERQNGVGDRRRTARKQRAACAAFQLAHGFLQ